MTSTLSSPTLTQTQGSLPPAIRLQEVSKVFALPEGSFRALDHVTLQIERGDYCAIMGPSGSGKSTTMNIIGCLDRPSDGRYWLDGVEVSTLDDTALAHIRNQKIGFVFQQFHLLPALTALENVMMPLAYRQLPHKEQRQQAIRALEQMGLGDKIRQRPSQLSGGQQQRVAVARAIVTRPTLLLADEPTGALDSKTSEDVMEIFESLYAAGMTIVMVTHSPDVAKMARRIVHFADGQILRLEQVARA
ncbi:MAG: ABC transporter ATP-binding protein [Cyanophyceae cyanobacterium]